MQKSDLRSVLPRAIAAFFLFFQGFTLSAKSPAAGTPGIGIGTPDPKRIRAFAFSKPWLKLLHYKRRPFGRYKSQVDSPSFFLAANGKKDPLAELRANLIFFKKNLKGRSRFPARFALLRKHLDPALRGQLTPELRRFLGKYRTSSVSVAFSSYYMNNPASVFGHLFLKLENEKAPLLDAGVDFTADTSGAGTFTFFFGGMTGYFEGKYHILSFHKKLREYNDFENRDVWLYRLKMDREKREFFLLHLRELLSIKYDYYFLSENCAYHILSAIEAVFPEHNLTAQTGLLVIPVNSIKILTGSGLVEKIIRKPSLRNLFIGSYNRLGPAERGLVRTTIKKHILPGDTGKMEAPVLDALIDYYNYRYPGFVLDRKIPAQKAVFDLKHRLFSMRSALQTETNRLQPVKTEPSYPPHTIHDAMRFGLSAGYDRNLGTEFIRTEMRFVFHDLADPLRGYPSNTAIDFLRLSAIVFRGDNDDPRVLFDGFTLMEYTVLNDMSFFRKSMSWSFFTGARRVRDSRTASPEGTFAPEASFRFGLSTLAAGRYNLESHPAVLLYALLKLQANYSSGFSKNHLSAAGGVNAGFKLIASSRINLLCEYEFMQFVNYRYTQSLNATLRWQMFQDIALDITCRISDRDTRYSSGLQFYL